jgi:hypothetical protein
VCRLGGMANALSRDLNNWAFNSQLPHSVVVSVSDIDARQPLAGVSF